MTMSFRRKAMVELLFRGAGRGGGGGYDYVYAASRNYIYRLRKSDLGITAKVSPSYGGGIYSMVADGEYIYAGGNITKTVRKYRMEDLTDTGIESDVHGDNILGLVVDNEHVYSVAGASLTVRKYRKSDLVQVGETEEIGAVSTVYRGDGVLDGGDFIYATCGSSKGRDLAKIRKADMAVVEEIPGTNLWIRAVDGPHVYATGLYRVKRYSASDLSFIDESETLLNATNNVGQACVDSTHVYVATESSGDCYLLRLRKSDLEIEDYIQIANGISHPLAMDDNALYVSSQLLGTFTISRYSKPGLVLLRDNDELPQHVYVLVA